MNHKNLLYFLFLLLISRNSFGVNSDFLLDNKKINQAKAQLQQTIASQPEKVFSFNENLTLGKYNYFSRSFNQAYKYLNIARHLAQDSIQTGDVYFWLGRNALSDNQAQKATQYFSQVLKYNKDIGSDFLFYYGRALFAVEHYDDALNLFLNFESKINNPSEYSELPLLIGASALGKGDYDLAERYLNKSILEKDKKFYPIPEYMLGLTYYLNNETDKSLEQLIDVKFDTVNYLKQRARLVSGTIYFNEKEITKALSEFNAIIDDTNSINNDSREQAYLRAGISYYKLKKNKNALVLFDSLLRKYPDSQLNEWAIYYTAKIHKQGGKWKTAKSEYKQIITNYPKSALTENSRFNFAQILYEEDNYIEAIPVLDDFVKDYPVSQFRKDAFFMLIQSYEKIENYDKVQSYGEKFIKEYALTPEIKNVHYILGEVGLKNKDYVYARRHFNSIKSGIVHPYALKGLADIYFDIDSLEQAVNYYNQAEKNCTDTLIDAIRYNREKTYLRQGLYQNQIDMFRGFLDKYPESRKAVSIQYDIGDYYFKQGNYEQALIEFDKVKKYGFYSEFVGLAEMRKAEIYKLNNQINQAIETYLSVVNNYKISTFLVEAIKSLADLYFSVQSYDSAIVFYNKLLSDYPKSPESEHAMIKLIEINKILGKLNDVIRISEQFIIRYPRSTNLIIAYLNLADSYKEMGKYEQAEKTLNESFNKIGKFGDTYFKLGEINIIQNKMLSAKNNFIEAYNQYLKENKKDLAALSLFEAGKCSMTLQQFEDAQELLRQCIIETQDERLRIQCEEQLKKIP